MRTSALILCLITSYGFSASADWNSIKSKMEQAAKERREKREAQKNGGSDRSPQGVGAASGIAPSLVCNASASSMRVCYAFTGAANADAKTKKGNEFACKMMRSKLTDSSTCPTDRAIGKCSILSGQPKEYVLYYYSGKHTKNSAEKDCSNPKSSIHAQGAGIWSDI